MVVLVIGLLSASVLGVMAMFAGDSRYPKQWDARVRPYADAAARIRGLQFVHPVRAVFHSEAEFVDLVSDDGKQSAADEREDARMVAATRAVGLAEGDVDLRAKNSELRKVSILAYYSPSEKRIHIRGTKLTVDLGVTLVHELTHALQDQHFDLIKMQQKARAAKTDATRGLIEGDASWVENRYIASLSAKDRAEYRRSNAKASDEVDKATRDAIPDILLIAQATPYEFGQPAVEMLRNAGSRAEVDRAFRNPPLADFLVVNSIWLVDARKADLPPAPTLPTDAKSKEDVGEFGAMWWFSMLAERIDPHVALAAIDGWAGDRAEIFERKGVVCTALVWNPTEAAAGDRMRSALEAWKAKMPRPQRIEISDRRDGVTEVTACDPGTKVDAVTNRAKDAFSLPLVRSNLAAGFASSAPPHTAWCAARRMVATMSVEQANDAAYFKSDSFVRTARQNLAACATA